MRKACRGCLIVTRGAYGSTWYSKGFSVDTGEQPVDTMVELLSSAGVNVSIVLLLSYIRYCINHGLKKDITLKIGYNKPAAIPMNFAVNEELLEEIFPGDVVEIN